MIHNCETSRVDSARACLWLVEQIAAKYDRPTLAGRKPDPIRPMELNKLRAAGYEITVRPAPPMLERKERSIFDPLFGKRGRRVGWNPEPMRAAVRECLELEASGERVQGAFKAIAARHGVHYGTLMDRLQIERRCGAHGVRAFVRMQGAA